MRRRNKRVVVRLTEDDYAKMTDFCKRGRLSKEAFWLKIVNGEELQEAPSRIYRELIFLMRNTGNALNNPKKYLDISKASFAKELEKAIELLDATEDILYYELCVHMKKFIEKSWEKKGKLYG